MSRRRQLLAYLASRLLLLPVMLWLIASLVFLLLRVAPGDPIDALLGTRAPEAARAALRHQLGLDQSLASQYGHYLWDLLHGQLGTSLTNQESVLSVIGRSLPASVFCSRRNAILPAALASRARSVVEAAEFANAGVTIPC